MSAKKLFELGYTDLVPVVPPDAVFAPGSNLTKKSAGKAPGRLTSEGWTGMKGWSTHVTTLEDCALWESWNANIGVRCDAHGALDIDSMSPGLAGAVTQEAFKILGETIVRYGQQPKRLLVYNLSEPMSRIALEINYQDEDHLIEWLGKGRQFVALGMHPSGVAYKYAGKHIMETAAKDLPTVTPEQVRSFFEHIENGLRPKVKSIRRVGAVEVPDRTTIVQETLLAPSDEVLREVVENIPNDSRFDHRADYVNFGMAVKAAARDPEVGLEIFLDWCARWESGDNDIDIVTSDWNRMKPPFSLGFHYLADMSSVNTAVYEFEAEPLPVEVAEVSGNAGPLPGRMDSDYHRAITIAHAIKDEVRFAPEEGKMFLWNGSLWVPDALAAHEWVVREKLKLYSDRERERAAAAPGKEAKALYKLSDDLLSSSIAERVLKDIDTHPLLTLPTDAFDVNPWVLCTPAGEIDLVTGVLHPPRPESLCTMQTAYSPKEGRPVQFLRYLNEATGGDLELIDFMQLFMGYALVGVPIEQTLGYLFGPSSSGKSVWVEMSEHIFGTYGTTASMETFLSTKSDRHPTDIAKLRGKRLVTTAETSGERSWDEAKLKRLTAGDKVSARWMRGNFFDFYPAFTLLVTGNHAPVLSNADEAMRRRLRIIPFKVQIPKAKQIDKLGEKLANEEGGMILSWMLEGCLRWQHKYNRKMPEPAVVTVQTNEYFDEQNVLGMFVDECVEIDPDARCTFKDMYQRWRRWCGAGGVAPGATNVFSPRLRAAIPQARSVKVHGCNEWRGIGLRNEEAEGEQV